MTYRITLLITAAFSLLPACGQLFGGSGAGGDCTSSALLGTWTNGGETISFTSGCGFSSSTCAATATATNATGDSGPVSLTGWSTNSSCGHQADRSCTYTISGSTLKLTCTPTGGGTYTRKS